MIQIHESLLSSNIKFEPSNHRTIELSNYQTIKSSNNLKIHLKKLSFHYTHPFILKGFFFLAKYPKTDKELQIKALTH